MSGFKLLKKIQEPSREVSVAGGGGRRKSYNTGGNIFPKSARPKGREKIEDNNSNESEDKVICGKNRS